MGLVGSGEDRAGSRGLGAVNATPASSLLFQRNTAHGGTGLFLDFGFAIGTPAPEALGKAILDGLLQVVVGLGIDRKSTRLNSSHLVISYAVFCLKKKKKKTS